LVSVAFRGERVYIPNCRPFSKQILDAARAVATIREIPTRVAVVGIHMLAASEEKTNDNFLENTAYSISSEPSSRLLAKALSA
jgi:hypothetical protein